MKKIDFLNELYAYLSPLPKDERNEILNDFREHFREGAAAGKSEEAGQSGASWANLAFVRIRFYFRGCGRVCQSAGADCYMMEEKMPLLHDEAGT